MLDGSLAEEELTTTVNCLTIAFDQGVKYPLRTHDGFSKTRFDQLSSSSICQTTPPQFSSEPDSKLLRG